MLEMGGDPPFETTVKLEDKITTDLENRIKKLEKVLVHTRSIISEGATEGFNPTVGDWADRLFANNGTITKALINKTGE